MGNKRAVVALASCFFGIGLMFWGFRIGTQSPQEEVPTQTSSAAQAKSKKPRPVWNVALGNVVVFAPELGFSVKPSKDEEVDLVKISAKIESQLTDLRDLYRDQSEKDPNLMGGILLQLAIGASGEVNTVKEIVSRIADGEFKKDLVEAVSKWDFSQIVSSPVTIYCPLVLVREGMDIRTVVTWEKSLGLLEDKSGLARSASQSLEAEKLLVPQKQLRVNQSPNDLSRQQKSLVKSNGNLFEVRNTTPIRKEPSYKSSSISQVSRGAKIAVVGVQGEWLEIRANGSSGFIPREFASPIE
jgi:hypothetical protein